MKCKYVMFVLVLFVLVSGVNVSSVKFSLADSTFPRHLIISVVDGNSSYFVTSLYTVAVGYSMFDGTFSGWCVETGATISRAPASHSVVLYSSLDPPANLTGEWNMVNYILNHKQGNKWDIQDAIWYFANQQSSPSGIYLSPVSAALVADALAHGTSYIPSVGGVQAEICVPINETTQITIYESPATGVPEVSSMLFLPVLVMATLVGVFFKKGKTVMEKRF